MTQQPGGRRQALRCPPAAASPLLLALFSIWGVSCELRLPSRCRYIISSGAGGKRHAWSETLGKEMRRWALGTLKQWSTGLTGLTEVGVNLLLRHSKSHRVVWVQGHFFVFFPTRSCRRDSDCSLEFASKQSTFSIEMEINLRKKQSSNLFGSSGVFPFFNASILKVRAVV